jgi:1,4-alpha-glucan branching enzyme
MMFWNNLNHNYNEATMGWLNNSNFSGIFYTAKTFSKPDNLVGFMESHDEERLMFKNLQYGNASATHNVKELATALKRNEMAAAFFFSVPGPKMIWQFGELGYDISIDQNGRTGEKPIRWDYTQNTSRKALYNAYAKLIRMKRNNPVFNTTNFEDQLSGPVKTIRLSTPDVQVMIVGNFDVNQATASVAFPATGTWYDYATGQPLTVPSTNYSLSLAPGQYHIYSTKILN